MSKVGGLWGFLKKRFGKAEDSFDDIIEDDDIDEKSAKEMDINNPEGNKSMRQGNHGQILGVDRKIVTGIAIFFVAVFCLAFIYASSGSDEKNQVDKSMTQTDIAGTQAIDNTGAKKLNDDYGELERANRKKLGNQVGQTGTAANNAGQGPQQQGQQGGPQQPASNTVVATQNPQQLPAVPRTNVVTATPPSYGQNYSLPSQQAAQSAEEQAASQREKTLAQRAKDRLTSAIAFLSGNSSSSNGGGGSTPASTGQQQGAANATAQATGNATGRQVVANSKPTYSAPTPNTITAGTIIPAMLVTGINTDSPGNVYAQIMGDVYDLDGINILIPAGSKVLGTVGGAKAASGRVSVTFNQLVMPNGGVWNIGESFVAMDGAGYSGLKGKVNKHVGSNFMKGIVNSAITAISTLAVDRVTIDGSAFTAMTEAQQPTTTVEPGYMFSIYVTQNIQF